MPNASLGSQGELVVAFPQGADVPNVQVKAGSDTRVRVGVLQVKAGSNTIADALDASGRKLDGVQAGTTANY